MTTDLDFATQLAHQAGALLLEYFKPSGIAVTRKPDHSYVTQADFAVDDSIRSAIQERYPTDSLLSEELQTTLSCSSNPLWVIDPLDGTTNFALELHVWGISIARLVGGQPDLCVLYFP